IYFDGKPIDPIAGRGPLHHTPSGWQLDGTWKVCKNSTMSHSWISYTNTTTGEVHTASLYKEGHGSGGNVSVNGVVWDDKYDLENMKCFHSSDCTTVTNPSAYGTRVPFNALFWNCDTYSQGVFNSISSIPTPSTL